MNRQEPYIGMPIILASFDEDRARQNQQQSQQQNQQQNQQTAPRQMTQQAAAADCNTACSQTETRQPMMLAMAYVPWQRWQETYPLDEGLRRGTIFPELDLPFEGKKRGGMRR